MLLVSEVSVVLVVLCGVGVFIVLSVWLNRLVVMMLVVWVLMWMFRVIKGLWFILIGMCGCLIVLEIVRFVCLCRRFVFSSVMIWWFIVVMFSDVDLVIMF